MEKQLTKEEIEQFCNEFQELLKKYNIKNGCVCGTNEKQYIGYVGIDISKFSDFFASIMNLGRLWQSAREKVSNLLNDFEK